jgi:hypothetical protein
MNNKKLNKIKTNCGIKPKEGCNNKDIEDKNKCKMFKNKSIDGGKKAKKRAEIRGG